jgi:hypothetical protein
MVSGCSPVSIPAPDPFCVQSAIASIAPIQ